MSARSDTPCSASKAYVCTDRQSHMSRLVVRNEARTFGMSRAKDIPSRMPPTGRRRAQPMAWLYRPLPPVGYVQDAIVRPDISFGLGQLSAAGAFGRFRGLVHDEGLVSERTRGRPAVGVCP